MSDLKMKLEIDEFKTGNHNIMLKVVFEKTSNFWIEENEGKATWVPKMEEVRKIFKALKVIDSGNKTARASVFPFKRR